MTYDEAQTVEIGDTVIVERQAAIVVAICRTPGPGQANHVPYFRLDRQITAWGWRNNVASFRICEKGDAS
jgi:hypothetical protein